MDQIVRYSLDLLADLGGDLSGLADALDGRAESTRWEAGDLGHRRVVDALEEFADSWDDKRELLTRSLRSLGDMASSTAETFEDLDVRTAREVADAVLGPA